VKILKNKNNNQSDDERCLSIHVQTRLRHQSPAAKQQPTDNYGAAKPCLFASPPSDAVGFSAVNSASNM
jgi:hypothetical protein